MHGRTRVHLERHARASGCQLLRTYDSPQGLVGEWACPDAADGRPMATAILLEALTDEDASVGAMPRSTLSSVHRPTPQALLADAKARVRFRPEEGEVFQSPAVSAARGYGDCDDSTRYLVATARSYGYPARLVYFTKHRQPTHVTAQIFDRGRGGWTWAEPTVDARYGEHPLAACKRLGMRRPDMDGSPVVLQGGRAVALRETPSRRSMGAMNQNQVAKVNTPATPQDVANAFAAAWPAVFGSDPPQTAILVLMAQSAVETAGWKSMYNWNFGNVHAWGSWAGDIFIGRDVIAGVHFISQPDIDSGASFYLKVLHQQWQPAVDLAANGDIQGYAQYLYDHKYYQGIGNTAAERVASYANGMRAWYSKFANIVPDGSVPSPPGSSPGGGTDLVVLLLAIAAGAWLGQHPGAMGHALRVLGA